MSKAPLTVDEAVDFVLERLPDRDRESIRAMDRSDLIGLHFGLGMWIRNNLGLWSGNRTLLRSCGSFHPDDASSDIIVALWERLQAEHIPDEDGS